MANKSYTATGQIYWCKVFGSPQPGYEEDKLQWSFDFVPDDASKIIMMKQGLQKKFKNKDDGRGDFIAMIRPLINRQKGTENQHIPVTDASDKEWPSDTSLGNGSEVTIKYGIFDYPARGKIAAGIKVVPYEIKVTKLVEYKRPEPKTTPEKPDANAEEDYS